MPTICAACGSATCSDNCHRVYIQNEGKCLMIRNFVGSKENFHNIQGFRSILLDNIARVKPGLDITLSSPRFITGVRGTQTFEIHLRRGFRQYGQPIEQTQKAMTLASKQIIIENNLEDISKFEHRLCTCTCNICKMMAPHPVLNCIRCCKYGKPKLDNIECQCMCSICVLMGMHYRSDCFHQCRTKYDDE